MNTKKLRVVAHFRTIGSDRLDVDGLVVRLMDQDPLHDDLLGETSLTPSGTAVFDFSPSAMRSKDSPLESRPDLYFVVLKSGAEVFRSEVHHNVVFDDRHARHDEEACLVRAFGPFRIDA